MKAIKTWMHTSDTSNLTARFCTYTDYTSHLRSSARTHTSTMRATNKIHWSTCRDPQALLRLEFVQPCAFSWRGGACTSAGCSWWTVTIPMTAQTLCAPRPDALVSPQRRRRVLWCWVPRTGKSLCVVDRYTLPLMDAVFNTDAQLQVEHVPVTHTAPLPTHDGMPTTFTIYLLNSERAPAALPSVLGLSHV